MPLLLPPSFARYRVYLPDHLFAEDNDGAPDDVKLMQSQAQSVSPQSRSQSISMNRSHRRDASGEMQTFRFPRASLAHSQSLARIMVKKIPELNSSSLQGQSMLERDSDTNSVTSTSTVMSGAASQGVELRPLPLNTNIGLECHEGTVIFIQLHDLEQQTDAVLNLDHDQRQQLLCSINERTQLFSDITIKALWDSRGVIQTVGSDFCLASWNFFARCPLHTSRALTAAIKIRDSMQQRSRALHGGPYRISIGVWSGSLVRGDFGTTELKSSALLGKGVKRVVALQQYGAMFGRTIVTNTRAWELTKVAPEHRLVPVDVLALETEDMVGPTHASGKGKGLIPSEIVYECMETIVRDADEWMYELQNTSSALAPDAETRKILGLLQEGRWHEQVVKGTHHKQLQMLCDSVDPILASVYSHLKPILEPQASSEVIAPYHRDLRLPWSMNPCPPHQAPAPQGLMKHSPKSPRSAETQLQLSSSIPEMHVG